jgi:hypothetical protein
VPGPQVGKGADGVELREVKEVDERWTRGDDPIDGLHGLTHPGESRRDGGHGDVGSRGPQAPEGMLRASPMSKEWFE